jgi:hypothetical protein
MQIRSQTEYALNQRSDQESRVDYGLGPCTQTRGHPVRKKVAAKQSRLKEDQAGGPDSGGTAQQRKQLLAGNRLNEKQKKASQKNGYSIEKCKQGHERNQDSTGSARIGSGLFFAGTKFAAELAELLLLGWGKTIHNVDDTLGVLREYTANQLASGGCDGGQNKSFIAALLLAFRQLALFQVINHQGEIAATGENAPGQVSETERSHMKKSFEDGELTGCKSSFVETFTRKRQDRVGCSRQLHVAAQGPLFFWRTFKVFAHVRKEHELYRKDAAESKAIKQNRADFGSPVRVQPTG